MPSTSGGNRDCRNIWQYRSTTEAIIESNCPTAHSTCGCATGSGIRLDQAANFSFDGTRRKEMMHVLDLVKVSRGRKSCFSSDSMWHEHTIVSLIVSASLSGSATHSTTFKSF